MHKFISLSCTITNTQIIIRSPDLTSYERLNLKTTFSRTMSGGWITHRATPVTRTHVLAFHNLLQAKKYELLTFIRNNAGLPLQYIDYFGKLWTVKLITKNIDITTVDTTGASVAFELESNE